MVWKRIKDFRREEHFLTLKLFTYWYAEHVVSAFTQVRSYQMAQMEKAYQRFRDTILEKSSEKGIGCMTTTK